MTATTVVRHPPAPRRDRCSLWLQRFGLAGFLFFLVKGLLWLMVPAALAALL